MALLVLDTSAIVKLYLREPGSDEVLVLATANDVAVSLLVVAEFASVVGRLARERRVSGDEAELLFNRFAAFSAANYRFIGVSRAVLMRASRLCLSAPEVPILRTLDAIHLATAEESFILARRANIDVGGLVTADVRLRDAATALALPVVGVGQAADPDVGKGSQ